MTLTNYFTVFLVAVVAALPATAANLVPNSSLECGAGRGWQFFNAMTPLQDDIIPGGFHGTNCLRLVTDKTAACPPLWLTKGVTYTFSWYEKANEANSFRYEIWKTTDGDGGTGAWVTTPTSWTRRSIQYTPPTTDYYQIGWYHFQSTMTAMVDALQVEVGAAATPYAPQSLVEAALATTVDHNTFFSADTKQVQVKCWNDGPPTKMTVYYEIFDLWNRKKAAGNLPVAVASGPASLTITLPSINGWQRITTRILRVDKSGDELTCAVMPFSAESGRVTSGILGTHTENDAGQVSYLRKLGFTWTRTLSPSRVFRWQDLEPTEDAYVWNDGGVSAISGSGMMILGTLHGGLDFTGGPAWAHNGDGSMKLDKWADFCADVVNRYKNQVTHWEIWNEPQQSGTPWIEIATNYAAMLTHACAAIKAADPTAKTVAMGGAFDAKWAQEVWAALSDTTKGQIDYVACHLYPNDNSSDQNDPEYDSRHAAWRVAFTGTRPIWNTETGTWGYGGMLTENSIVGYYYLGAVPEWQRAEAKIRSRASVDKITRNFLRSIGNGFTKYFYYDSRKWTRQAAASTQPYSWEYTGSLRPTIVSLVIANSFLDQYISVTRPINSSSAALELYVFEMGASRVAAVFNNNRVTQDISTAETSFTVYDAMGNAVTQPSGRIRVTKTPQYVVSSTLSVAQMTSMLQGAVANVADTTVPNISIDIAPGGSWGGGDAMLKWSGIDETYVNSATYTTNVVFAWKLDSGAYTAFSATNFLRLPITAGNHTLWVKARDRDGNESETSHVFDLMPPANLR